jgi:RNA polymerase sigma factor (sigma-70 family)
MALTQQMDMVAELQRPHIEEPVQRLYEEYYETITAQIRANGGSRDDGADIFQEAVLVLIENVKTGRFRGESSIKTFLSAIARNLWLHELRTRGRRNKRELIFSGNEEIKEELPENRMDPTGAEQLMKVLGQVGEPCHSILTGFYYENKSMKELLKEFDYENEQVLRNRKSRCMKKLKELIANNTELLKTLKSCFLYE